MDNKNNIDEINNNINIGEEDDFSPIPERNPIEPPAEETEVKEDTVAEENEEAEENTVDNKDERPKYQILKSKKFWIPVSIATGLAVCTYFGGAIYYSSHFFNNTQINNFDCSNLTVEEAKKKIEDGIANYTFTLHERNDVEEIIKGSDISFEYTSMGSLEEAKEKQNPFKWLIDSKNRDIPLDIEVSFDEDALYAKVTELQCVAESNEDMADAESLVYYEGGAYYTKVDETRNIVSVNSIFDKAKLGMQGLYPGMVLEDEGCYVGAASEDRMRKAIEVMDRYVSAKVTYLRGEESTILDGDTINQWITLGTDYTVTLNEDMVEEYVEELAKSYNTIGMARKFTTTPGNQITVYDGDYGWWVNTGAEAEALVQIIKNGEQTEREPIYRQTAAAHGANNDIANTYVEINLSMQHLWYYHDGELIVSTDFVSGDPTKGYFTPTGVYGLSYKERNATLKGEGYASPVNYWMPFNGNVGMHDAPWRGSFGGEIYKGGGSHGCVNLPYNAAATIYGSISKGDPVIVY